MASKSKALNEYVLLGNSGLRVSPLCLGAMTWGTLWTMGGSKDDAKAIFTEYCKAGGNFIDTANKYHEGESESWLGEFMEEANNRDDLVIATKFTLPMPSSGKLKVESSGSNTFPGMESTKFYSVNMAGNTSKNLHVALAASLKRLRTTYIDISYVHHWDWTVDTQELMKSLNDVVASGKVLYLGISDAPSWVISECNAIARARGWAPFQVAQHRYSLIDRTIEQDVLNYALYRPLSVVNWAVLGSGVLTGKYKKGAEVKDSERAKSGWVKPSDKDYEIAEAVEAVAKDVGCSPSQVAIAWARAQPGITSPLIGCRTLEQFKDNVGALKIQLSEEQLKRLNDVSKIALGFPFSFVGTNVDSCPWPKSAGKIVV